MAATWTKKKELQAARREADVRDDTDMALARQAFNTALAKAAEVARGPAGTNRGFYQGPIEYEGSKGSNSYARRPIAENLVELLKKEGFDDASVGNCYDSVQFSW